MLREPSSNNSITADRRTSLELGLLRAPGYTVWKYEPFCVVLPMLQVPEDVPLPVT
jgi:hypothetical protein